MKTKSINEGIGDILKPKSDEEVKKALEQFEIKEKIEGVKSYFRNAETLILALGDAGADKDIFIDSFIENASQEELKHIAYEYFSNEAYPFESMVSFFDDIDIDKLLQIYFEKENIEEIENVLNLLLINNAEVYSRMMRNKRNRFRSHFGYDEDDED